MAKAKKTKFPFKQRKNTVKKLRIIKNNQNLINKLLADLNKPKPIEKVKPVEVVKKLETKVEEVLPEIVETKGKKKK